MYPTAATPSLAYRPAPPPPALLSGSGLVMDPNPIGHGGVISTMTSSMMYTSVVSGSVQTLLTPAPYTRMSPPPAMQFPTMYTPPSVHTQSTSPRDTRFDQRANQMNIYPPQPSPSCESRRSHLSEQRTDSMSHGNYQEMERMENLGRLLTTGGEDKRRGRTQAAADIEEHSRGFLPPPPMCPYHPRIHFYSPHQLEPHLIVRYGVYQQHEPPYGTVTFNESYPCGTSALKPAKRSKLSQWFPCFFET